MPTLLEAHAYVVRNSALSPYDAAVLLMRLAVWIHLTASFELPALLRAEPRGLQLTAKQFESIFRELGEQPLSEPARCLFDSVAPSEYAELSEKQLVTALRQVWSAARWKNGFDAEDFEAFLSKACSIAPNRDIVPTLSVADVLVQFADCPSGQPLACLGSCAESVAIAAMKRRQPVVLWSERIPIWASAYAVLFGGQLTLERCDPTAVASESVGSLGVGIAVPPFGLSRRGNTRRRSTPKYVRFLTACRQALKERLVCVIPNRLLFASGEEAALRQDLVTRGDLSAVVSFPPGLLIGASVPFSVLLIEPDRGAREIRILSVDEAAHVEQNGQARRRVRSLINSRALVNSIQQPCRPFGRRVAIEEVAQHDFTLTPDRYLHEPALGLLHGETANECMHARLTDLVTIHRPQALPSPRYGPPVSVVEVGASDLPRHDYIRNAWRERMTDTGVLEKRKDQLLQPGDVLLAIKGDTGATGIFVGDGRPWVASQSLLILRMRRNFQARVSAEGFLLDPVVLLMLLRSPPVQAYLRSVTSVSTVPIIQAQDIERLQLPILSLKEQERLIELFQAQCRLTEEIARLEHQQLEMEGRFWEHEN